MSAGDGAPPLRLATRRSALALAQSKAIGEQLAALTGRPVELVEVTTQGDVDQAPLAQIGGTGVFVAAVREAVAAGRADVAVHSLKDLPTTPDPRLVLAAVPPREDPRDALVARGDLTLATLPAGARVGTGSPRRRAQLAALRPDLELVELRGNVDTRMARVRGDRPDVPADLDAVVLAVAGLARLGRAGDISERLDVEVLVPAPGQGALAVEVAAAPADDQTGADADRVALLAALDSLDHQPTRAAVTAERTVLSELEAGCSAPVGALATVGSGSRPELRLVAVLAGADGALVRRCAEGDLAEAELLGKGLAAELLAVTPIEAGLRTGSSIAQPLVPGASTGPATHGRSPR